MRRGMIMGMMSRLTQKKIRRLMTSLFYVNKVEEEDDDKDSDDDGNKEENV